jgi:hypothetical protein
VSRERRATLGYTPVRPADGSGRSAVGLLAVQPLGQPDATLGGQTGGKLDDQVQGIGRRLCIRSAAPRFLTLGFPGVCAIGSSPAGATRLSGRGGETVVLSDRTFVFGR